MTERGIQFSFFDQRPLPAPTPDTTVPPATDNPVDNLRPPSRPASLPESRIPRPERGKKRTRKPSQAPTLDELYDYEAGQFMEALVQDLEARGLVGEDGVDLTDNEIYGYGLPTIDDLRERLLEEKVWFREQAYEQGSVRPFWMEWNRPAGAVQAELPSAREQP